MPSNLPLPTWPYVLRRGHTSNPAEGACAMDAINWLVHGKHGDSPECPSQVIAEFVTECNDLMPDDIRQRLLPYLHRVAGSRSPAHETARRRILWLANVRVFAPHILDTADLPMCAESLRALPDTVTAQVAVAKLFEAAQIARTTATQLSLGAAATLSQAASWLATWSATTDWSATMQIAAKAGEAMRTAMAAQAASTEVERVVWDDYFVVLDAVLNAGPQGEPWSADVVEQGTRLYQEHDGLAVLAA